MCIFNGIRRVGKCGAGGSTEVESGCIIGIIVVGLIAEKRGGQINIIGIFAVAVVGKVDHEHHLFPLGNCSYSCKHKFIVGEW